MLLVLALAPSVQGTAAAPAPLFVPELRVIHEFVGEGAGDQFGWIGRNAGDCDRDGVNDVLLSAPTRSATIDRRPRLRLRSDTYIGWRPASSLAWRCLRVLNMPATLPREKSVASCTPQGGGGLAGLPEDFGSAA